MRRVPRQDLYPPPIVPEAVPATVDALERIRAENRSYWQASAALGCVYLRQGSPEEAAECLRNALEISSDNAEVRCNLGVALAESDRLDDALLEFKRALLLNGTLLLAHLHVGRILLRKGLSDEAAASFKKVLEIDPAHVEALAALGDLADEQGDTASASELYERAFFAMPKFGRVQNRLAQLCFSHGSELFEQGSLDEAFAVWGEAYRKYARSFSADQKVSSARSELARSYSDQGKLNVLVQEYRKRKRRGETNTAEHHYVLFSRFYFTLLLIPELYVSREQVDAEVERWKEGSVSDGVLPYAHYRHGVALTYRGALDEAYEALSFCRDHLPVSKQRPLKLDKILRFIKELLEIPLDDDIRPSNASADEWSLHGFADPFQREAWKKAGLAPEDAAKWKALGFSAQQARSWSKQQLGAFQSKAWRDAGFDDPAAVRRWLRGDFTPDVAREWSAHFPGNIETAIQAKQSGLSDAEEASRWLKIFRFPYEAVRWAELGFTTQEAALYVREGITDPYIAKQRQEEETRPAEAVNGLEPADGGEEEADG